MGAQENRGREGYGRREVWTPLYLVCGSSNPLHYNVCHQVVAPFAHHEINLQLRACLHGGGGPSGGEVTCGESLHLSCKRDQIKIRDYMDRRVTSTTWGSPPPCKQGFKETDQLHVKERFWTDSYSIIITICTGIQ